MGTAASTCAPTPPTSSDRPPRVRLAWATWGGRLCLHAAGWTAEELERLRADDPGRLLAVLPSELVAAASRLAGVAPTAGRFELVGEEVRFAPRHPFRSGIRYSLLWTADPAGPAGGAEVGSLEVPAADTEPVAAVREIHP